MNDDDDRYLTLTALSQYSSLSVDTLRRGFTATPALPYFKHRNRVLVRRSDFDAWLLASAPPAAAKVHERKSRVAADVRAALNGRS
jgi:hypothetical protein